MGFDVPGGAVFGLQQSGAGLWLERFQGARSVIAASSIGIAFLSALH